jgi:hypothetical protein
MTDVEKAALKERVAIWQSAAPLLEAQRDADIRSADTADAMRIFTGSADWAVKHRPALPISGLVEQQRWFMKIFATL